jgi:predicted nucleic acid-binding protein
VRSVIVLDSGVLALVTHRRGIGAADACRDWVERCTAAGASVLVPAIVDFETRRELLQARKSSAVVRLDRFIEARPGWYILLTDEALHYASHLWAESRQRGLPTADPRELDVDVILVAQSLTLGVPSNDLVIATTNLGHLSRFLDARLWTEIDPSTGG